MKISTYVLALSLLVITAFTLPGCANWSKTATGAVIGTGAGAAVGSVIGKTLGNTAAGAIAGAAVGGTAGAIIGRNMDNKAREMEREMDGVTIQRVEEGIAVSFDSGILFGFDSSNLQANGQENLEKLAGIINRDENTVLMIVGHTDSVGNADYNIGLSERRAKSAADYMIARGLPASRIQVQGRGANEPIANNETDAGREKNRRVEVAIFASPEYVNKLQANN